MAMELHIVLYILSLVNLIQCPYPPTGDEVVPGSVLLPASRRGRYLANIVRRQAVDGTGIKFNKDADRMNAESKKKVDVLSEELLPYIIAEQERRTTLHKRVMTAIQNGEKGITIAEMRNKPPLIIRKGLMYRCPANRAPKEPDGSGILMCEEDITPTQIMYDACLSAEDKELYNAENKYFFCNRHKIEGPDLPRNGTTVYGCAPIERTSYNYTTSKCSLEDTEDVVVHYRYYPDRTYKYVTELDSDREVCEHWNPCQIGYIFSLPSPDMATPASELWPETPPEDYEKDEIVPPIPEDSMVEYIFPGDHGYTTSPRTINIPHHGRRTGFSLDKIQVRNSRGQSRKVSASKYSVRFGLFSLTITLSFESLTSKNYGTYYSVIIIDNKPMTIKFLSLAQSAIELLAKTIDCLHGQRLNGTSVDIKCERCRVLGLMVRARDHNIYNVPSSRFRVRSSPYKQQTIELNIKDPQPQDFGDYFALIENNRGLEERHKILTVRENENLIQLNRFDASCDVRGNYNNMTKYECKGCELTDVLCNGQSVLAAGRVTILPQSQQISYNFPSFNDQFSCVYMGFFKIKDTVYKKIVAVIQTVKIHEILKVKAPKEDESLDEEISFESEGDCEVREVTVNGISLDQSSRRSGTTNLALFQASGTTINIHIGPFLEAYAGVYQAKFMCGSQNEFVTKNIMEVTLDAQSGGEPSGGGGDHAGGANGEQSGGQLSGGEHSGGEHKGGEHSGGEHKGGEHSGGEHKGGEHSGGEHKGGDHPGGDHGAAELSGGENKDVDDISPDIYKSSCHEDADDCTHEVTFSCGSCKLKAVKCRNAPVEDKIKIDEEIRILYEFKGFKDTESCVYMGEFDVNGKEVEKVVAVIDNADIKMEDPGKTATVAEDAAIDEDLKYETAATTVEVEEVYVNGHKIEKKDNARRQGDAPTFEHDAANKHIKITVPKVSKEFEGYYQAKFKVGEKEITKNILEVILGASHNPEPVDHQSVNENDGKTDGASGTSGVKLEAKVESCAVSEHCEGESTYECDGCELKAVKCNGEATDKVTIDAADKKFTFKFDSFENDHSCVYMGEFDVQGTQHEKALAVIDNKYVNLGAELKKETATLEQAFNTEIDVPAGEKTVDAVEEVHVNGHKLEQADYSFEENKLKIHIVKVDPPHFGYYQAKFKLGEEIVTKNVLELENAAGNRKRRKGVSG